MEKKQSYIVPETEIVSLHTLGAVAINPGHGEQLTTSFEGEQGAKEFTLDDGDFEDFDGDVDAGIWDIPEFTTPPSWEE
jgi:hypothetical protein